MRKHRSITRRQAFRVLGGFALLLSLIAVFFGVGMGLSWVLSLIS